MKARTLIPWIPTLDRGTFPSSADQKAKPDPKAARPGDPNSFSSILAKTLAEKQ